MEVKYKVETDDYYAAQQYICRSVVRNSYWRFLPTIVGVLFGACLMMAVLAIIRFYDKNKYVDFYDLNWGLVLIILGFITLFFGLRAYNRVIKTRIFSPDGLYRSPHTISIFDDKLIVSTKDNTYIYSYYDILRVDEDQSYVYVFIDSGAALYIPKKAFSTPEAMKAFINDVSNRIKKV